MEPILPEPITKNSYEVAPENAQADRSIVQNAETSPNTRPSQPYETMPIVHATPAPTATAPHMATPISAAQTQNQPQPNSAIADPIIADDVDVIEKEWVDKAKRIVSATKADPHQQETEVSKLQADYLLKRYNKNVKLTES